MTTKATARSAAVPSSALPLGEPWLAPPLTTEDRLLRIRALGQRVDGHVQALCAVVGSRGVASTEAKEKAVAVFYECLRALEQRLGRIQEDLRLE